jgi:exopolyphosphatase / guanosine-5'-triphosphate,3'-diphosphate pyrophosphatase
LPVFVGGVAIVYATFKSLGISQMTVSDGALREGLIHDLLGRIYNRDIRSETVGILAARYHTDKNHAARIKQTAQAMLKQLKVTKTAQEQEAVEQFLDWAVELHEIGRDIAHSQYHKHGAYIIENGDLAGFSQQDQILLATLVLYHRKKFPGTAFKHLPPPWRSYAPILVIILRLAVLLHRNRYIEEMPAFEFSLVKNKINLVFPYGWLQDAPLTQADLTQEADYLEFAGFKLTYF